MTVTWDRGRRSARKGGCDTELDGDAGKVASRMTPGICSTEVLSSVHSAASSRVFVFFFSIEHCLWSESLQAGIKENVWIIMVYLCNAILWNQNKTMKKRQKSLVYIFGLKKCLNSTHSILPLVYNKRWKIYIVPFVYICVKYLGKDIPESWWWSRRWVGPRLSSQSLPPVDRSTQTAGVREELSPAQMKDRDRVFLTVEVKETFLIMLAQKGSLEVKKGVMSTTHRSLC